MIRKVIRRATGHGGAIATLPEVDVRELASRIGSAPAERTPTPALSDVNDLALFALLGGQKLAAARESGSSLAIVVLAVDAWTRVDAPREPRAELPLEAIAQAIRTSIRAYDRAARYGTHDFVLLLDRCDRAEAQRVTERLTFAVGSIASAAGHLAVSGGIAMFPECDADIHGLIAAAEAALRDVRRARRSGFRVASPLGAGVLQAGAA